MFRTKKNGLQESKRPRRTGARELKALQWFSPQKKIVADEGRD